VSEKKKSDRLSREMRLRARELRKQSTPAEKLLWEQLRGRRLNGIKFRRQHVLSIVGFYSPGYRLVIELDGEIHGFQDNLTRTEDLEDRDVRVLRFWNYEVVKNLDSVLIRILEACYLPFPTCWRRACPARSAGVGNEGKP
jgi:very-short-patch-repair endonuclease